MGLLRGAEFLWGVSVGLGMSSGVIWWAGNGDWETGTSNVVVDVGYWMLDARC